MTGVPWIVFPVSDSNLYFDCYLLLSGNNYSMYPSALNTGIVLAWFCMRWSTVRAKVLASGVDFQVVTTIRSTLPHFLSCTSPPTYCRYGVPRSTIAHIFVVRLYAVRTSTLAYARRRITSQENLRNGRVIAIARWVCRSHDEWRMIYARNRSGIAWTGTAQ